MIGDLSTPEHDPVASVVIGTRDRAGQLERCLASVAEDRSLTPAEVIVVDNGSTDNTCGVVRAAQTRSPRPIRMIRELRLGSSSARNAGIRVARGELVLFTDDDVTVQSGWIDGLVSAFRPGVAAVGGRVHPELAGRPPSWFDDERNPLTLWDDGDAGFEMTEERHPLGANLAIRRALLLDLEEPFDTRLGHFDGVRLAYEEVHLISRLLAEHRILYTPDAVVHHHVNADRLTYEFTRRAYFHYGFGRARHQRLAGLRPGATRTGLSDAVRAYRYAVSLRIQNRSKHQPDRASAQREFEAYFAAGRNIEMLFASHARIAEWCAKQLA